MKLKYPVTASMALTAAIIMPIEGFQSGASAIRSEFKDMKVSESGYAEVTDLSKKGIIRGYEDETFRPYEEISREHVAVLLVRALRLPIPADMENVLSVYKDVDERKTYAKEIAAVTEAGIFKGGDNLFRPEEKITRAEMASALVQSFGLKGDGSSLEFADFEQIDESHRDHVAILAQNKIAIGRENHIGRRFFDGGDYLARIHFAVFLSKALEAPKVISAITADRVKISGRVYPFTNNLHGLFRGENAEALKNAPISFTSSRGVITNVKSIQLLPDEGEQKVSILDGHGVGIVGNMEISRPKVAINHMDISGDLDITSSVFASDGLKVQGNTFINCTGESGSKDRITFSDASLGSTVVGEAGADLLLEASRLDSLKVLGSSTIKAAADTNLPHLLITGGTRRLAIDGKVEKAEVSAGRRSVILKGKTDMRELHIRKAHSLHLDIAGKIENLYVRPGRTRITLGKEIVIENISLPAKKKIEEIITDYENHKEQILRINGNLTADLAKED